MIEVRYDLYQLPAVAGSSQYMERVKFLANFNGVKDLVMLCKTTRTVSIVNLRDSTTIEAWNGRIYSQNITAAAKAYEQEARKRDQEGRAVIAAQSRFDRVVEQFESLYILIGGQLIKIRLKANQPYAATKIKKAKKTRLKTCVGEDTSVDDASDHPIKTNEQTVRERFGMGLEGALLIEINELEKKQGGNPDFDNLFQKP